MWRKYLAANIRPRSWFTVRSSFTVNCVTLCFGPLLYLYFEIRPNKLFLKTSFNQVWGGSATAPAGSLVVWQQAKCRFTFRVVLYLLLIKVQFDLWSFHKIRDDLFMCVHRVPHNFFSNNFSYLSLLQIIFIKVL